MLFIYFHSLSYSRVMTLQIAVVCATLVRRCGLVAKLCLTFVTPLTVAHQAPQSIGFSRQKYWSGLPFPFPGDLPNPGIKPMSAALTSGFYTTEPLGKPQEIRI